MIAGILNDIRDRPTGQKVGILAFVIVAVFLLDWQWLYGPRSETLAELRATLAQRRDDLEQKRAKTDTRAAAERELRELQAELRRAEARLPDQREIGELLSAIAASARGVGLDITLFRQKPETYAEFYAQVPVEMKMRGTYHDVALFLDRVRRLDRIVNVGEMKLERPTVKGDQMVLDAAVTATTFRFLNEAERARIAETKKSEAGKGPAKGGARSGA